MTTDAVRLGYRVVEIDVEMSHRATGRSPPIRPSGPQGIQCWRHDPAAVSPAMTWYTASASASGRQFSPDPARRSSAGRMRSWLVPVATNHRGRLSRSARVALRSGTVFRRSPTCSSPFVAWVRASAADWLWFLLAMGWSSRGCLRRSAVGPAAASARTSASWVTGNDSGSSLAAAPSWPPRHRRVLGWLSSWDPLSRASRISSTS